MEDLRYAVWYSLSCGACCAYAAELLRACGSFEEAYHQRKEAGEKYPHLKIAEGFNSKYSLEDADEVIRLCRDKKIEIFHPFSAFWPSGFRDIPCEPVIIYACGDIDFFVNIDAKPAITIVGTRSMSEYGRRAAYEFAYGLSLTGMTVISGLADGVDSTAHRGALDAGAKTLAVMGCGLDISYPAKNRPLEAKIFRNGAIISEYPPKTPPARHTFPQRNRLMSALGKGVLVAELKKRSGALITANWAAEQNRSVFALMTDYDRRGAPMMKDLISDGAYAVSDIFDIWHIYEREYGLVPDAERIESARKILIGFGGDSKKHATGDRNITAYYDAGKASVRERAPRDGKKKLTQDKFETAAQDSPGEKTEFVIPEGFDKNAARVYALLSDGETAHVDDIAARLGISAREVSGSLTLLEIEGAVSCLPGRLYKKK